MGAEGRMGGCGDKEGGREGEGRRGGVRRWRMGGGGEREGGGEEERGM